MTEPSPPPVTRRRIEHKSDKPAENRSGCLIWGAVLGVVVGGMFAAYGLKPILRHYYGEQKVAVGQTYSGDAKTIRVERVDTSRDNPTSVVVLTVVTNKTWAPTADVFSLQYEGVGDWQEASAVRPGSAAKPLDGPLPLAEEVSLTLEFPRPPGSGAARYLHISDPRVRFELPQ